MKKEPTLSGISVALQKDEKGTQLVITGAVTVRSFFRTKEERFKVELPVDVISIDGKPYYVPRTFYAYSLTEIGNDVKVQGDIVPSVKYTKLESGIYVPVEYVSDSAMKKLEELDKEYLTAALMSKLHCEERCDNYDDFVNTYRKKFVAVSEQVHLLLEELRTRGFEFRAEMQCDENTGEVVSPVGTTIWAGTTIECHAIIVEVVGPDGDIGYYVMDNIDEEKTRVVGGRYRGKWSLLAKTYSVLVKSGLSVTRQSSNSTDEDDVTECTATLEQRGNGSVFVCDSGEVAIAVRPPNDADRVHKYHVVCKEVAKDVCLALSFAQIHNVTTNEDVKEIVTEKGVIIQFGRIRRVCSLTRHTLDEVIVDKMITTDVVSLDNKIVVVPRDECGKLRIISQIDPSVKPSVKYVMLPGELYAGVWLYIPVDYVGQDVISMLQASSDIRAQGKLLVDELTKKGFKFSMNRSEVIVVGPDGEKSYFRVRRLIGPACYQGKWSLVGEAYYYYYRYLYPRDVFSE